MELEINIKNKIRALWLKIGLITALAVIFLVAGYLGYNYWQSTQQILPTNIKQQIDFPVFWPNNNESVTISKKTIKYDSENKTLSYIAQTTNGNNLTVTEQATPDSFAAAPQVYTQLLQDLVQFEVFNSRSGTVYLTHPKELNGGEAAVMNSQGTLMFIKPVKTLSDNDWHKLFNNLQIVN